MRTSFRLAASCLVVLASAGLALAEIPESVEGVPNYHKVSATVATAGQPSPEALKQLARAGFKTVINLRTEAEGARDQEPLVTAQGLRYVWIPVTPATLTAKEVDAVRAVLRDESAGPVLLHCTVANRAGGLWAATLARDGKSVDEAEAEGVKAGLTSAAMKEAVRRVSSPAP
jgi:uncharacterized protein (TIGR01244 family)